MTWEFFVSGGNDVHARRFNAAGVPQGDVFSPGSTAGWQSRPAVDVDGRGNFVIAWTVGGPLASQDVFARRFTLAADTTPPAVTEASFDHRSAPHKLVYRFTEDVYASLSTDDLVVKTVPGDATVAPVGYAYDPATNTATFTLPAALANGNYRTTLLAAGVSDAAGVPMGGDHVTEFFVLAGDVNRDRSVNGTDFALLAANFGRTGRTYGEGDVNGDGAVNGTDFAILAGNFGRTVPVPAPAVPAVAATVQASPAQAVAVTPAPRHTVKPKPKAVLPPARRVVRHRPQRR